MERSRRFLLTIRPERPMLGGPAGPWANGSDACASPFEMEEQDGTHCRCD
jgi:hypothetical protein